jgi:hypothetical protein
MIERPNSAHQVDDRTVGGDVQARLRTTPHCPQFNQRGPARSEQPVHAVVNDHARAQQCEPTRAICVLFDVVNQGRERPALAAVSLHWATKMVVDHGLPSQAALSRSRAAPPGAGTLTGRARPVYCSHALGAVERVGSGRRAARSLRRGGWSPRRAAGSWVGERRRGRWRVAVAARRTGRCRPRIRRCRIPWAWP